MVKTTEMLVEDMMKPANTIKKGTEITEAVHLLKSKSIEFLSVVDEEHRLLGVVSENSLIKLVKHEPSSPVGDPVWFDSIEGEAGKRTVETIMTTNITTIKPKDDIATTLKVMDSVDYKLIHVVDPDGRLLGTVRMREIFEKILGV